MHLTLSPCRGLPGAPETGISVQGDIVTVDGEVFDLSDIPEGGEATPTDGDHPFVGSIIRFAGTIHCTLRVQLGDDAENNQPTDPERWVIADAEGPVTIPALRRAADTEETIE